MLYLSGIVIAFFLSVLLSAKKNKSAADYILLAWLIILGIHLLLFYIFFSGRHLDYPAITALGLPLPLVHGPFLYLYTCQQTTHRPFRVGQLLHFTPVLLSYLLFINFFLLPESRQADVFRYGGHPFETQLQINVYAIYVSGIVYITLSLVRLFRYKRSIVHQFSNIEKINFNWLLYLILWLIVIWIVVLFVREDGLIYAAASLFVLWLGYFGIRQVQVFSHHHMPDQVTAPDKMEAPGEMNFENHSNVHTDITPNTKYQKSGLTDAEAEIIHERLKKLLAEEKPYKDPELTLDELAKNLDVHPNTLSQVINSREHKTFYDLVNEKRVNAFIQSLSQPSSQQFTLLAIAFDSGFNSKASFNRNFKKYTGQTPSDYLKLQLAR